VQKTYLNYPYGYMFTYPSNKLFIECSAERVYVLDTFSDEDPCQNPDYSAGFSVAVVESYSQELEVLKGRFQKGYSYTHYGSLVAGRVATSFQATPDDISSGMSSESVLVVQDGLRGVVIRGGYDNDLSAGFRFLNTPEYDVSRWKTIAYTNLGFSFKYPPDILHIDYPERCYRAMKPTGWFGEFSVWFHLNSDMISPSYLTDDCEPEGEDGSQIQIDITKGEKNIQELVDSGAFRLIKKFSVSGAEAYYLGYHAMGGEGGDRVYVLRKGYTYYMHLPNFIGLEDNSIDPLFATMLSTFNWKK
jgi:hypothetical protein